MSHTPTEADCVAFDLYVAKWQQRLNLTDWRIERGARRPKKVMADVSFDDDARLATYRVGQDFGSEVTADSLERTALHELLHVFLHDAVSNPSDANEHRVINVLEKILMGASE